MKISKKNWMVFTVAAVTLILLTGTPAIVTAGGEPGAGCEGADYKYDPAPFIGDLTVECNEFGYIFITGDIVQAGNTGCTISLDKFHLTTLPVPEDFPNLKSNYLRRQCIENVVPYWTNCDFDGEFFDAIFETVACGGLSWINDYSFSANFVIMKLE